MPDRDDDEPLAHPHDERVLAVIRAVLRENRWPSYRLEDGTADVEALAWESRPHPTTVGGWKALCRTVAKRMAIDRTRSEVKGGKDAEQSTDRADEHEGAHGGAAIEAAIDRRKAIEKVASLIKDEKERAVFVETTLGSSQQETAQSLGMTPREVSRRVKSMQKRFKQVLAPVGLLAVLAVGAYVLFHDTVGPDERAHNQGPSPSSAPSAPPGPTPEELAQQQRAKADELRKLAEADCAGRHWARCSTDLDDAQKLDPQGDGARRVQRLYGKAARGEALEQQRGKPGPLEPRTLSVEGRTRLVSALGASKGQSLRLVCVRDAEAAHFCGELAAAITSAGWSVTRATLAPDAGDMHGLLVEVATDADDATQAAADVLGAGLEKGFHLARGPDDVPPGGDAPLRLTVGRQ
jgi:DNA-directed RNA polymerase specialized sigma24 family protein